MRTLVAVGAYGREACEADWNAGKDFRIASFGPYFSKRDVASLKAHGYGEIKFVVRPGQFFIITL